MSGDMLKFMAVVIIFCMEKCCRLWKRKDNDWQGKDWTRICNKLTDIERNGILTCKQTKTNLIQAFKTPQPQNTFHVQQVVRHFKVAVLTLEGQNVMMNVPKNCTKQISRMNTKLENQPSVHSFSVCNPFGAQQPWHQQH